MITTEDKQFAKELHFWLSCYTTEVIEKVLSNLDVIKNDNATRFLLKELYIRGMKEQEDATKAFIHKVVLGWHLGDIHNHCLTHSESYRDVLYDMYIRPRKEVSTND